MDARKIVVLGVGNLLLSDEGLGIRALEELERRFIFPENVRLVDGGTLGLSLLGILSENDELIILDAVCNRQAPGTLHRLTGDEVPARILNKNSLHQVDLLEGLTITGLVDKAPRAVVLGLEPADITTVGVELSPKVAENLPGLVQMAVAELERLGVTAEKRQDFQECAWPFRQRS